MTAPDLAGRMLAEVFPFHLLVDRDARVHRTGRALVRICPALVAGAPVGDTLDVTSPRATDWRSLAAGDVPGGLVLLAAPGTGLVLRGQFLAVDEGVLFLGSPWVTSTAELDHLGLRMRDFAVSDPVSDFLLLLQAQASALADAQALSAQLEQIAAEQAHQASHDGLTGLPNRGRFAELLSVRLTRAAATGGSVGVVLLDLDRFKEINDTLGHLHGDRLLQQIGPRVRSMMRSEEVMARLGGDEFALLLTSDRQGEQALADYRTATSRVLRALQEQFLVDGIALSIEASAGIAMSPEHGTTGELLLQHADTAMYAAKGRHEDIAVYERSGDDHSPRKLTLLTQLRSAMPRGELVLHYQPLLHLSTGEVRGVEALVRWQHPVEGLLPPADFLPLAEGSGLVHELTRHVLHDACRQAKAWQRAGRPLVVSVNLSARCLLDAQLPDDVAACLARKRLPARLLKLEITESAIIGDPVRAQSVIARLHALGVALSIDDFGTGYTSLAYLRDLPVQELKIDRSFVQRMLTDPKDAVIVRTGVELAARLGLESVAEGIEDAETLQALVELGCTTAQGYHVSRPVPAKVLDAWLRERALVRAG